MKLLHILLCSLLVPLLSAAEDIGSAPLANSGVITVKKTQKTVADRTRKEGMKTIGVDVLVRNDGNDSIKVQGYFFKVQDEDGFLYDCKLTPQLEPEFPYQGIVLKKGGKVRGWVAFLVPEDLTLDKLKISYQEKDFTSDWIQLK